MEEISIAQARLNLWRKQGFLEKELVDFYDVVETLFGLHSTDYWSPYLSVWSRIGDYDAKSVFDDLNSGKHIIRSRAFRNTQHVILVEDLPLLVAALGSHLERSMMPAPPIKNLTEREREHLLTEVLAAFEDGPLNAQGLKRIVPNLGEMSRWLLLILMARGLIVRTEAGNARSNQQKYDLTSRWLPGIPLSEMTEHEARTKLVYKYVSSFGPVSVDDLAWWLPCKKSEASALLSSFREKLSIIKVDGNEHYMITEDYEAASNLDEDNEVGVVMLPYEDSFPKAYANRTWFVSDRAREVLFPRRPEYYWPPEMRPPEGPPRGMNASGELRPSIWYNGMIVGRWEIDKASREYDVRVGLVEEIPRQARSDLDEKRDDLVSFINDRLAPIS
jgi:uncharacterized protein YcaQ